MTGGTSTSEAIKARRQTEEYRQWLPMTRHIRRAFAPFIAEYRALLQRLRQEGFRVRWTCLVAPVILEGHPPSGEAFYFRCRHQTCRFAIGRRGQDLVRAPAWQKAVTRWQDEAGGSPEASEAEAVLRELLAHYYTSNQTVEARL